MTARARVFLYGFTSSREMAFEALRLEFVAGAAWSQAHWVFEAEGRAERLRAETVSEISSIGLQPFTLSVQGDGQPLGAFEVVGVIAGEPTGAHCLIYKVRDDGVWSGHAISSFAGRAVLVPYGYDPT